jgi:antitoxin component of MazEF toxin-antitoxin module
MNYTATTAIRKWGNGYGVLLPKRIVDTSVFAGEGMIELVFSSAGATLRPQEKSKITLASMVAGMPSKKYALKNRHDVVDFGADVGKELWQ